MKDRLRVRQRAREKNEKTENVSNLNIEIDFKTFVMKNV